MSGDEIIDRIPDPFENKLFFMISGWSKDDLENVIINRHKRLGNRFRFLRKPIDELVIADKYLEMEQFFINQPYPFPLAYAFNSLHGSPNYQAQVTAIKDFLDIVLRFSVSVLMSDLRRIADMKKQEGTDILNKFVKNLYFRNELSMGAWFQWLENVLTSLEKYSEHLFMPELMILLQKKENPLVWMSNLKP